MKPRNIFIIILVVAVIAFAIIFYKKRNKNGQTSGTSSLGSLLSGGSSSDNSSSGSSSTVGSSSGDSSYDPVTAEKFPLRNGSRGDEVKNIQKAANTLAGKTILTEDGIYGSKTESIYGPEVTASEYKIINNAMSAWQSGRIAELAGLIPKIAYIAPGISSYIV